VELSGQFNSIAATNNTGNIRFEVVTAETMKKATFCDTKTQIVPHTKHYVSATEPSQ
jgi:hypothetical protein